MSEDREEALAASSEPDARTIGSLALSCLRVDNPMKILRAASFRNALVRLGMPIPFFAVHDLGLLAVLDPSAAPIGPRPVTRRLGLDAQTMGMLHRWADLLRELATTEAMTRVRSWHVRDDLVGVLLFRLLSPIWERHGNTDGAASLLPLIPAAYEGLDERLPALFQASPRASDLSFLARLAENRVRLRVAIEQIDLDTLRLLGMTAEESGSASALRILDLLAVFESPEARDVARFCLDLLPSLLETKRAAGAQVYRVEGYAGIERRGSLEAIVTSELAFDPDVFARRLVDDEIFRYAREKEREEERRLHCVLIDATASMRGDRSVFARGLGLGLAKKLLLSGEEVTLRFFDSRLYETVVGRRRGASEASLDIPYILSFRGERGRNYVRVFERLATDLERIRRRGGRRPIVHLLTHGECHVPVEVIERVRAAARIQAVFLLPSSGTLELDYLHLLDRARVVDERALLEREPRARRALEILG